MKLVLWIFMAYITTGFTFGVVAWLTGLIDANAVVYMTVGWPWLIPLLFLLGK